MSKSKTLSSDESAELSSINRLELEEAIRRRAFELFEIRSPGADAALDDWLQAEIEILSENSAPGRK